MNTCSFEQGTIEDVSIQMLEDLAHADWGATLLDARTPRKSWSKLLGDVFPSNANVKVAEVAVCGSQQRVHRGDVIYFATATGRACGEVLMHLDLKGRACTIVSAWNASAPGDCGHLSYFDIPSTSRVLVVHTCDVATALTYSRTRSGVVVINPPAQR